MQDLGNTLESMNSAQLVAALIFFASYVLALGGLATARGKRSSFLLAGLSALVFVVLSPYWVYGALLVVCAVLAVGGFIALVWALSAAFGLSRKTPEPFPEVPAADAALQEPVPSGTFPKLVRRLRRHVTIS